MRLLTDKYGRTWLVEYRTYTLLTAKELYVLLKKTIAIFLFSIASFGQSSIVSGANKFETFGSGLVELQIEVKKDVPLSIPTYTIEKPKPIVKKKLTFWQKIKNIFNFK